MARKILKNPFVRLSVFALLVLAMVFASVGGAAAYTSGDSVACIGGFSNVTSSALRTVAYNSPLRTTALDISSLKLYVGGMPFGVKFMTEGVIVTGLCEIKTESGKVSPAEKAGLRQNDIILKVNGASVTDAAFLSDTAEASGGAALEVLYERDGRQATASLCPAKSVEDGKYKTGMYVRDSGAGIGTVTYIVPDTLSFGGLGHGICDGETGKLIPMQRGSVVGVTISGVVKGLSGSPGEVRGYFSSGKTGTLLTNTECGVFGAFASLPEGCSSELMPVGTQSELKDGKAYILSTLDGTTPQKYEIEISSIRAGSTGNKCFNIKVTDKSLLDKSGGIVQGMSGSPIIQNGKLIGAVTHVLVNDPTAGYGIFIENMLSQMGSLAG